MNKKLMTHHKQSGFALAWAAVLTIIAGMVAVTMINVIQTQQTWSTVSSTQDNIEEVVTVLTTYQRNEHSLPCPASLVEPQSSTNFGIARNEIPIAGVCDDSGTVDATGGTHTFVVNGGGAFIRIGAIPNRTLGIPDHLTQDKWGNRLVYAVTEPLTDPFQFTAGVGEINIVDDTNTIATDIGFIVIAQGSDQKGAYRLVTGTLVKACTGGATEIENCDFINSGTIDDQFMIEDYSFE